MTLVAESAVTFLGGALYEAGCVGWVHFSEKGRALPTALFSMLCATADVTGIGVSIHDLRAAPFFVLGYGIGTFTAVRIKQRWSRA